MESTSPPYSILSLMHFFSSSLSMEQDTVLQARERPTVTAHYACRSRIAVSTGAFFLTQSGYIFPSIKKKRKKISFVMLSMMFERLFSILRNIVCN